MVEAATIFSIASILDAISNPVMGYINDNFYNTRVGRIFGRRRFFISYTTQMKLDRKNHSILLEEIERIKSGGAMADIPAHARAVAEELTGWKYEQCWGNNPLAVKESSSVVQKPVTES